MDAGHTKWRVSPDLPGDFCTSQIETKTDSNASGSGANFRREPLKGTWEPKKKFTPEQIVPKLRQIEVLIGQGKAVPLACKEAGITAQTFYRWRKEYGGLQLEQARRLKNLQKKNAQLRRAVADLTVEKQILKDIAQGNF